MIYDRLCHPFVKGWLGSYSVSSGCTDNEMVTSLRELVNRRVMNDTFIMLCQSSVDPRPGLLHQPSGTGRGSMPPQGAHLLMRPPLTK